MNLEFRHLMTFKRVAELRSFTKGAEALFISQPAVSHQIRLLEETLGHKLFEFHGRKARLTTAGEALLVQVEQVKNSVDQLVSEMDLLKNEERGRITVAAIGSSTVYVLPDLLDQFQTEYPHIEVTLKTLGGDEIREMVTGHQFDLGIVGSHVATDDFLTHPLFKDSIAPFVHAQHPMASKKKIRFAELAREPLIQLGTWRSWENYVLSIFRQVGVSPTVRLQLDSIDAVKRMVERGLGFTIIPDTAAREEIAEGKLVRLHPVDVPPLTRQVLLIHLKNKIFSKAQQKFVDFLLKAVPKR